jgi:hypothetical protein
MIPKKIKIGGHVLNVEVTNDCDIIAANEIGITTIAKNIIYINKNFPLSRQQEALLHETIHNCFFDLNEEQDEELVVRLGTIFFQVLKDNPGLMDYIKESDQK